MRAIMAERIDRATRVIPAPPSIIYPALADARALEAWLPPDGMTGRILAFDFRPGGSYRLRLTYDTPSGAGKTSADTDEVEVRYVDIISDRRIEQAVTFDSDKPEFAGVMTMTWELEPVPDGTEVTVRCEHVPRGIPQDVHEDALAHTLAKLARHVEARP